jgi:hypothetical protein
VLGCLIVAVAAASAMGAETARGATIVVSPIPDISQPNGFVATEILDLELTIRLDAQGLGSHHLLEVGFLNPDGHLYELRSIPFTTSAGAGVMRQLPGYPLPVEVQSALPFAIDGADVVELTTTLPVAGTAIVSHSLYGQWQVELALDGAPVDIVDGDEITITLTPSSEVFSDGFESGTTSAWSSRTASVPAEGK